ncbi:TetR/AcrR family transcriptional regulator [Ancylobacter dichloromethanicus]|uniref:TetR family transcriptional regulator n=1 Tax=Ancylobacter dichloromethanicus TaxID=518825 RepID=A0A9W6JAE6_9HYPH|nr:TetR/AcrR family transcriptional regulator [Ancylobacter dichloromethanicus]MBS7553703.1 TetR/AcrR family transcriptional regulator [Ancylobacter dichloromethanicus]GLK72771.1 TetR family transcriptional regulator [Ancylobacter dichloromethanicus]
MARPREFDEAAVLDAAVHCFWSRGYEATSVRDLIESTGLTGASIYNAFGDKRAFYRRALAHYVQESIADRIRRCEGMAPRAAIDAFFAEILKRSLSDKDHKGCMLVNAALEVAPQDTEFKEDVAGVLNQLQSFFLGCVAAGQADGTITTALTADELARHLLGVLMGVRVLARVRPEKEVLEGVINGAFALLDGGVDRAA